MFSYRTVHKHNIILKKRLDQRGGYYTVQQFAEAKACSSSPHWHYLWNKCFKGDILRSRKVKFHTELRQAEDVRFNQDFLRVANHFYVMKSAYFYDYNCTNLNQITRQKNAPSLEREKEHFNRLKEELDRVLTNFKAINVSEKAIDALYCKFLQRVYLLLAQHSTKNYFNELNQLIVSDKIYQETCEHFGNRARRIERKAHFISKINSLKRLIKNKFRM